MSESLDTSPADRAVRSPGRRRVLAAVGVGFLVVFLTSSIKNVIPANLMPMADYLAVGPATVALGPTTFMIVYGLASPVIGGVADRWGARNTITAGLLLAGASFLGSAAVPVYAVFVVLYGVGAAVAFVAVSYIPLGVLADELFPPDRRGLLYALLTNGTAIGFVVLSPLWVVLSASMSWRLVFAALGLVFLVPLALLNHVVVPARQDDQGPDVAREHVGVRAALALLGRTPGFWVLSVAFLGCGVTMGFIDVHVVSHLRMSDESATAISATMVVLGVTEFVGALLAGRLCDQGLRRVVLVGSYGLRAVSMAVLVVAPGAVGSVLFAAIFGVSYMGTVIATTMYALDILDPRCRGLALGLIWFVHQLGSGLTSQGGALSVTWYGSYVPAILAAAAVAGGSFLLTALVTPRPVRTLGATAP